MISIDVRHLALSLISEERHPYKLLVTIAERMVEAAIDIVNSPENLDTIIDPLVGIYERDYKIHLPDLVMLNQVKEIQNAMDTHGWDRRLKVKVQFKRVGLALNLGIIRMDLDATFVERERLMRAPRRQVKLTGTDIRENPSSDEINEFLNAVDGEAAPEPRALAPKPVPRKIRSF